MSSYSGLKVIKKSENFNRVVSNFCCFYCNNIYQAGGEEKKLEVRRWEISDLKIPSTYSKDIILGWWVKIRKEGKDLGKIQMFKEVEVRIEKIWIGKTNLKRILKIKLKKWKENVKE